MTPDNNLYDTPPSKQPESQQRTLAERVLGEHTFGTPGVPEAPEETDNAIAEDAPRIWCPELHAALFSRTDLTAEYIREFITEEFSHYETEDEPRVLRLPGDSEQERTTAWCSYSKYFNPQIVGGDKPFYEFWAAEEHPAFTVTVDIDYTTGQLTATVTETN
ncbi:hypothetical protein [Salinibaculum rarum]|uniref:hypothetical protein n=1 Tax=Salinibaculum rarum TaxID=3058903 RepID=UPI00265FE83B|nr:hypothetical protein [Salinibaculum sp. KK48]